MKCLLVTRRANGGMKTHLETLANKLPVYDVKPILCGPGEDYGNVHGADFLSLPVQDGFDVIKDLKNIIELKNIIDGVVPDIVHAHGYKASFIVGCANRLSSFPWISTIHNFKPPWSNINSFKFFTRWILNRANMIQTVSNSLKEDLVISGADESKCRVLYNGVFLSSFHKPYKARKELSLPRGNLIGCISRLNHDKGVDRFLYAVRYLLDNYFYYINYNKYYFVVAGDGPQRNELKKLAWNLGIASKVFFLGHRRDIKDILKQLEAICIPSRQEGLSLIALEAMASFCPVVAAQNGGLSELVQHGKNGILIPYNTPGHIGEALMWVIKNRQLKRKISWQGYIKVIEDFNDETMLKELVNIYKKCSK